MSELDLVFIISAGRSGSTLLRKLLIEKIEIHVPPESSIFIPSAAKMYLKNDNWENRVEKTLNLFSGSGLNEFWKLDLKKMKNDLLHVPKEDQCFKMLIFSFYKKHAESINNEQKLLGDKSPILNMHLKWLTTIYPNAKYIHLIRDPYDVTYSRMINFGESIELASSRWLWGVNEVYKYNGMINLHEVHYKSLAENTEVVINNLMKFINANPRKKEKSMLSKLGDEKLPHHQKLSKKIEQYTFDKKTVFTPKELSYLNKKFKNWNEKFDLYHT